MNIKPKIDSLPSPLARFIKDDIRWIQERNYKQLFQNALNLFFKKYQEFSDCIQFLTYFKKNWCDKNNTWFEGAAPLYPSTNNALERFNLTLKESFFKWERLNLAETLKKTLKSLESKPTTSNS